MVDLIKIACQRAGSEPYQQEVEGEVFGAWAAHDSINGVGFKVTFLRFGLALPFEFVEMDDARSVAKEVNELRDDWSDVTHADVKSMGKTITAICERFNAARVDRAIFKGEPEPVEALPAVMRANGMAW